VFDEPVSSLDFLPFSSAASLLWLNTDDNKGQHYSWANSAILRPICFIMVFSPLVYCFIELLEAFGELHKTWHLS
jgi:hypothetical protein